MADNEKTKKEEKNYLKYLARPKVFNDLSSDKGYNCDRVCTGSLNLDYAIGGGMPRPGIVEIYGPEASGKTTLSLHAMVNIQREDKNNVVAFIDVEHALDPEHASRIGLNLKSAFSLDEDGKLLLNKKTDGQLLFCQPDSGEEALNIVECLLRSGFVQGIVIDSVAALVPKSELDGEMGDAQMGTQARLMGQALRKITPLMKSAKTLVIFTNQVRDKIGVLYGNPETTSGGKALKFYSRQRFDIRKQENILRENEIIGIKSRVKCVKNKVGPAHKTVFISFGMNGIIYGDEYFDMAIKFEIIKQSGGWFYFGDKKIQGKDNAITYFNENPKIQEKVKSYVNKKLYDK